MKTEYKFIHFEESGGLHNGKPIYICLDNKNYAIGKVYYKNAEREYYFNIHFDSSFDVASLSDAVDFLKQLNEGKKNG
jgi:hypothetical protein